MVDAVGIGAAWRYVEHVLIIAVERAIVVEAPQLIVARAADQRVVTEAANQRVVSCAAEDRVGAARRADASIPETFARKLVGAGSAN